MITTVEDKILYLNRKDLEIAYSRIDSVAIVRDVFRQHAFGQVILPDEAYLSWTNEHNELVRCLNMPGYIGGSPNAVGTKIINANIANPARGLPRASGLTLLFDDTSARVKCVMEGAYLSSMRTASVTLLSVDLFKGREIERVAIIGAGILAQAHIEMLVKRLPYLRQISVFDVERKRIATLKAKLASVLGEHRVELHEAATAEEAIKLAQLIIPVTTTTTGYIQFDWLQRGSLLVNISLDDPLPEVIFKADRVIVDDWNLVKNDSRRLIGRMYRAGQIIGPSESSEPHKNGQQRRCIDAQLGEVVIGTSAGRKHPDDIILVNPFGLAIEDVALAAHVYQMALSLHIGVWLVP